MRRILRRIRPDFGQIDFSRKNKKSRSCKSKQVSCGKSDPEMVFGSFVCSCDQAVRYLDSEHSGQRRLLPCLVPRRDAPSSPQSASDSRIRARAWKYGSLSFIFTHPSEDYKKKKKNRARADKTLVSPRTDVPRRFTCYFVQPRFRAPTP